MAHVSPQLRDLLAEVPIDQKNALLAQNITLETPEDLRQALAALPETQLYPPLPLSRPE